MQFQQQSRAPSPEQAYMTPSMEPFHLILEISIYLTIYPVLKFKTHFRLLEQTIYHTKSKDLKYDYRLCEQRDCHDKGNRRVE